MAYLLQLQYGIVNIARCHTHIQDDLMVMIHRLAREYALPTRLPGHFVRHAPGLFATRLLACCQPFLICLVRVLHCPSGKCSLF